MTSPPSIPPRPSRTRDEAESSAIPAIPPRPRRSKSPMPEEAAPESTPSPVQPPEPAVTTIPPNTELRAPQARVPVRPPVRKNTGIPQIGSRVPMYPNAGDVQAPAPSATPGSVRKAHVYREEWEMDEGAYGSMGTPRLNPYTRSSNDLNQSVAQEVSAPETFTPVPDEEIGYLASEHFARVISPQHTGTPAEEKEVSLSRMLSDSAEDKENVTIHLDAPAYHLHNHHPHRVPSSRPGTRPSTRPASPTGRYNDEDEDEDEEEPEQEYPILASDEVLKRVGQSFMLPAVSPPLAAWRANSTANNTRPASPARHTPDEDADVEPVRLSGYGFESRESLVRESLESGERPEPLFPDSEPEDEPAGVKLSVENKGHEKLKRPSMPESMGSSGHKFPSKDVWEEAPEHSQLETTVTSAPPLEKEITDEERESERMVQKRSGENPATEVAYIHGQPNEHYVPGDEVEFERKQKDALKKPAHYQHQVSSSGADDGLDRLLKRGNSTDDPEKLGVTRAKVKRFPSNDIWEDVPPSLVLSARLGEVEFGTVPKDRATTGGSIDPAETEVEKRPTTGAPIEGPTSLDTTTKPEAPTRPVVPAARPPPKTRTSGSSSPVPTAKKFPPVPDRPKPKVSLNRPTRPSVVARSQSTETPPTTRPKPSIPPRTGGKIAALKAGFLSDLDNRLKLGQKPPKKEAEPKAEEKKKEKVVLEDVRKGRAKGPRRKLPTVVEKAERAPEKVPEKLSQTMSVGVWAVWSVDDVGSVEVLGASVPAPTAKVEKVEVKKETKEEEVKVKKEEVKDEVKQEDQKEELEKEELKKEDHEVPNSETSILPGVTGTGVQSTPAVKEDVEASSTPAVPAVEDKLEKGEIPALVPAEEHPEDAAPAADVIEKKVPVDTEVASTERAPDVEGDGKVEV